MVDLTSYIREKALPFLKEIDAFIVDIQQLQDKGKKIITLFIDTDSGITIDQCAEISKQLSKKFEQENAVERSFILQISSPGLNRPIKLLRQYKKGIGRNFHIRYKDGQEEFEIHAKLVKIDEDNLEFVSDKDKVFKIKFDSIIESSEELPW